MALALGGCVTKTRYASLEASYDEAVAARDAAQSEAEACAAARAEAREPDRARATKAAEVVRALRVVEERHLAELLVADGRVSLELPGDALFAPDSADLTDAGLGRVKAVARLLADLPDARFQVEGHTDAEPVDSKEFPTSWHLAADRAVAVVTAMVDAGFPAPRLSASSYAGWAPVGDDATEEGRAENRRVEIVWMPDLAAVLPFTTLPSP